MKFKLLITNMLIAMLLCSNVIAQEELTLEKAIALGFQHNFQLKINEQSILIAQNNDSWAVAGGAPTIAIGGNLNNDLVNNNNPASFLQGSYYAGSLNGNVALNWIVLNGGRVRIARDQLGLAINQQQIANSTTVNNLVRDIYQSYYNVILQQEQLNVLQQTLALSKSQLEYENSKREFGVSNSFNLLQFESGLIADSVNLVAQELQFEITKRTLFNLINLKGTQEFTFPSSLEFTVEEIDPTALKKNLVEANPNIKSLELLREISALNTKLEKAAWKPTISLTASGGATRSAFQILADDPTTGEPYDLVWGNQYNGSLGASFNWNIFDGGVRNTNIENARMQEEIDRLSYEEARLQLMNQLEILVENHTAQNTLILLSEKQLEIANRNLEMTEERFRAGTITSIDFRNIQTQQLSASFNRLNALYNLIVTKSEIDALIGAFDQAN